MIWVGDCAALLRTLGENSIDAIVTDPPYGIAFMNKKWDYNVPSVDVWRECRRVLKPGGHALIACGTRTQHRMVVNIEDAGFEIRDVVTWLYGQGFPKSLDISKAIDKSKGAERDGVVSPNSRPNPDRGNGLAHGEYGNVFKVTYPSTDLAKQWHGWGTALKPACEFWTLARKPLDGTVANNIEKWGVGGLNIDGCRIGYDGPVKLTKRQDTEGKINPCGWSEKRTANRPATPTAIGRFPANLILDDVAAEMLDEQSGQSKTPNTVTQGASNNTGIYGGGKGLHAGLGTKECYGDSGGASRFFYCAKASKGQRGEGNNHPTVKPLKLMSYLCRLITPPNGLVLDPFAGSGSTGVAALGEGFRFQGIELNPEYAEIARRRIGNT